MTIISMRRLGSLPVEDSKGRRVGTVEHVLFASDAPRVVGYEVEPRPILWVIRRRPRYLALDATTVTREAVSVTGSRAAWGRQAAKRLGIDWQVTVIWLGMPVVTQSGESLGEVRDALIDTETGALEALGISGGVVRDAAVGVRDIGAEQVVGFDGSAVRVLDAAAEVELSGGAAAAAGKATAKATVAAVDAARTAARYGAAAAKAAEKTEAGRTAMGWLRSARDAFKDAMEVDEEDD